MKLLKMILSAPMQSWGEDARWDQRTTALLPTKSGMMGLLGCCLGYERGSDELRSLDEAIHMAVRIDNPGNIITDFHTVQGMGEQGILNAEGKKRGDTIITPKSYLQEASFSVFFWGDEEKLLECEQALRHPKWMPFLGRRSCPPAVPLLPIWISCEHLVEALRSPDSSEQMGKLVRYEIEMLPGDALRPHEHLEERPDRLIRADRNEYAIRRVRCGYLTLGGEKS